MDVPEAVRDVLSGASLAQIRGAYRDELLESFGIDPATAREETFRNEARAFVNKVCRELGDRCPRDLRVQSALAAWAAQVEDYDVFDALLTNFTAFEDRAKLLARGRRLFPGPLTAHWSDG
ncbi:MAG: hypothetical protein HZB39_10935 [Planctomycetes bacterium]|nr:hypothetical protein [Planctomycetota bacterium]